jgi:hypothetical protein
MYQTVKQVPLATGEIVDVAIIRAPEPAWAERIEKMLAHKGDPWIWQNTELLRLNTSAEARFFVLHRNGRPFSNIMLVETAGVAILGHVWTEPADRQVGASAILMQALLDDFWQRGGQAIFLGTGYDTPPWHYYARRGFVAIEAGSGYMARYAESREAFDRTWFGAKDAIIEPIDWVHWPASTPLFLGDFGGVVRIAATQLVGRQMEGPLLPLIRSERQRQAAGQPGSVRVLCDADGPAVLGLASLQPHPLWPDTDILDIYCHNRWWHRAHALLKSVPQAANKRTVAYCDATQP